MMKICPNCGLENIAERTICKRCHAPLQADFALASQHSSATKQASAEHASARSFMTKQSAAQPLGLQEQLRLWIAWILATTLSPAVFGALQQSSSCASFFLQLLFLPVLFGVGIGLAAAQWLVLRRALANAKPWIIATGVAWILASIVELEVMRTSRMLLSTNFEVWNSLAWEQTLFPAILAAGLVFGAAQALVLRRLAGAAWWVPATIAGVILATLGLASVHDSLASLQAGSCAVGYRSGEPIAIMTAAALGAVGGATFGLAIGALTGAVLIWLLRSQSTAVPHAWQRIVRWLPLVVTLGMIGASLVLWLPSIRTAVRVATPRFTPCWYTGPTNAYGLGKIYGQPTQQDSNDGLYQPPEMLCSDKTSINAEGRWRWVQGTYQDGWVLESYLNMSGAGVLKPAVSALSSMYEIRSIDEQLGPVTSVGFSRDGRMIFAGSAGGGMRVWDVNRTQESRRIDQSSDDPLSLELTDDVVSVAPSPDGHTFLMVLPKSIWLIDAESGRKLRRATLQYAPDVRITGAIFSPDGRTVLSTADDGNMRLWDTTSGTETQELFGHERIMGVAFTPDGQTILAAKFGRGIEVWKVTSGRELSHFGWERVTSLAISPDGKTVLAGAIDGTVLLWDVASEREIQRFTGHADRVMSIRFSPDGQTFLSGGADGTVRLWDLASGREVRRLEGHTNTVTSVAFSPDGHTVLSGSWDGTLRLWRLD
jgi:hypothetical protein